MLNIAPLLPDAHLVRTYPGDYAETDTETDTETEGELHYEEDTENEELISVSTRLEQNQQFMDRQVTSLSGENSGWILEPQLWKTTEDTQVILIKNPTASNLSHRLLNPFIYRNIRSAGTLDDLAKLLDSPSDWEVRYNQVVEDGRIIRKLNRFSELPEDTLESTIQMHFVGLVEAIAYALAVDLIPDSETKIIVGGILAHYQYDLRSKTDPHFLNTAGFHLIASEAKTHRTFAPGEMWYHGSRGIQVLSALYAYNCPTFLFTQRQWKLFVENDDRNTVLTFPYGENGEHTPHVNSSQVQPMGTTFLKAIVICLLSRRSSLVEAVKAEKLQETSLVKETPKKTDVKEKYFNTTEKPQRRSARLSKLSGADSEKKVPTFISGYVDKFPIYSVVRVLPQEVVDIIEDEISLEEKAVLTQQSSAVTLFE